MAAQLSIFNSLLTSTVGNRPIPIHELVGGFWLTNSTLAGQLSKGFCLEFSFSQQCCYLLSFSLSHLLLPTLPPRDRMVYSNTGILIGKW